jgi:mono/diheme cytochrome c family protein
MHSRVRLFSLLVAGLVGFGVACQSQSPRAPLSPEAQKVALVNRGRAIYQTQCTACHHSDPHKPGSLGPDVWGSSRELLEARIVRGEYPKGYTPKRSTHIMVALPHLKGELDALTAYLNQP